MTESVGWGHDESVGWEGLGIGHGIGHLIRHPVSAAALQPPS